MKYTDEDIMKEVKEILSKPQLRRCIQCASANEDCSWCTRLNHRLNRYMSACSCQFFETNEEKILRETREAMEKFEREEQKVNVILTMCLNCMDAAMLYLEDFSDRVEYEYKRAEARGRGDARVRKQDRCWIANLKRANKQMTSHIEMVRKQYNQLVMPIFNKVFFNGEAKGFDVQMYDDHQEDASTIAHLLLRYSAVSYQNPEQANKVFELIKSLETDGILEEKDFNHYNFRR